MLTGHQISKTDLDEWLETSEQFSYGHTKDSFPKQLRVTRKGDFFIIVNGALVEHTRSAQRAVAIYNGL